MISFDKHPYSPVQQKIADQHKDSYRDTITVGYYDNMGKRETVKFPVPIISASVLTAIATEGRRRYYVDRYGNILRGALATQTCENVDDLGARGNERRAIVENAHKDSAAARTVLAIDNEGEYIALMVCENPIGILYRYDSSRVNIIDVTEVAETTRNVGYFVLPLSRARRYEKLSNAHTISNKFRDLSVNPGYEDGVMEALAANDEAAKKIVGDWVPENDEEFTTVISMCRMFDTMLHVPTAEDIDRMCVQWQEVRDRYI